MRSPFDGGWALVLTPTEEDGGCHPSVRAPPTWVGSLFPFPFPFVDLEALGEFDPHRRDPLELLLCFAVPVRRYGTEAQHYVDYRRTLGRRPDRASGSSVVGLASRTRQLPPHDSGR